MTVSTGKVFLRISSRIDPAIMLIIVLGQRLQFQTKWCIVQWSACDEIPFFRRRDPTCSAWRLGKSEVAVSVCFGFEGGRLVSDTDLRKGSLLVTNRSLNDRRRLSGTGRKKIKEDSGNEENKTEKE